MNNAFHWLTANITWIKDILTSLFSATAILIAVLTYRKARDTFLRPIRTEVIKKQSILLTELLEEFGKSNYDIESALDYHNIVSMNVLLWTEEFGFIINKPEQFEKMKELRYSTIFFPDDQNRIDVTVVSTFTDDSQEDDNKSDLRAKYEAGKREVVTIDKVHVTKKFATSLELLQQYIHSPLMPTGIQKCLIDITREIDENMGKHLRDVLRNYILELFQRYQDPQNASTLKFDPNGVFNKFNRTKYHHVKQIKLLRKAVRDYLRVDDPM